MAVKCLQVLLALSALSEVAAVFAKSNQSSIELLVPHDESFRNILSLDQINKIMLTEVTEEFGGQRRLTKEESNSLWNKAMEYEWLVAEDREAKGHPNGRRTQDDGEAGGSSPFVVCDMHFGKTGESCKDTVEVSLGVHLIVSEIKMFLCLRFLLLSNIHFACFLSAALQQRRHDMLYRCCAPVRYQGSTFWCCGHTDDGRNENGSWSRRTYS
jgi:hypothetical protein